MSVFVFGLLAIQQIPVEKDVGPLVRSLWLLHQYGTADAVNPDHDQIVKGVLAKAIAKDGEISLTELGGLMTAETFNKIAGADGKMDANEIRKALSQATPESRNKLAPKLREHAEYLTTTFDAIDELHRKAGQKLATWIVAHYKPGMTLPITVVCTGNSRRSIMGSSMGNLSAAYYGMPEIRFHSGGTAPSAFNPRTIASLKSIGFEIEAIGKEADRGDSKTANPIYHLKWGDGYEMDEFSKHYSDQSNPQSGFAALMVCTEADGECPIVKGANLRISMPYLDPKIYDDGAYETSKYAERRDDIGRFMLAVMAQARREIASKESVKQ
jgi:arsenate reductase